MTRFMLKTLAALALSLSILPGQAAAQNQAAAPNQETVKGTYGDWEVRCSDSEGKLCVMAQIGKTADGKTAVEVRIRKLEGAKGPDGKPVTGPDGKPIPAAIQITTPLGTLLRGGVQVTIDGGEPRSGPYEICVPSGCVVREAMSEEFLASLKSGNTASMTYKLLQRGDITATISLKGFTKAYGAL